MNGGGTIEVPVLVVGGGPVGLTLALDLARRGVEVLVVERRARGTPPPPKCNHVAARSMEIFRRLNKTKRVKLIIALVMPGGRYEASERSESEIEERIDYLTEMAETSGGTFVNVTEYE